MYLTVQPAPFVISMGTIPTTPAWTVQRTDTISANAVAYLSFVMPSTATQSFIAFVSTIGSASTLQSALNNVGLVGTSFGTPNYP